MGRGVGIQPLDHGAVALREGLGHGGLQGFQRQTAFEDFVGADLVQRFAAQGGDAGRQPAALASDAQQLQGQAFGQGLDPLAEVGEVVVLFHHDFEPDAPTLSGFGHRLHQRGQGSQAAADRGQGLEAGHGQG